jgi:hypothetical protein
MKDHPQYVEMLALYALGALDPAEESELQAHLRSCPQCGRELAALRGDAALLALSVVGPAPPQGARQRLLAAIGNEPSKQPVRQSLILGTLRPRWLTFVPIAATLLLAIFSLMLWRLEARLQRRLDRAQAELQDARDHLQKAQELVALLHSPDSMHVTLVSQKTPPQPQANAVYSPKMGRLLLTASNLEALPEKKVYELWLLPAKGGSPMPCGTFWPNAKGDAMMDHPLSEAGIEAKGFAITVEPEGGSQTPTMPIRMIGNG